MNQLTESEFLDDVGLKKPDRSLGRAEAAVIHRYKQQLPMNNEFKVPKHLGSDFYHYNPGDLITIGDTKFKEYCRFIIEKIKESIF